MAKNKKKSKSKTNQASNDAKPQSQDTSIAESLETDQTSLSKINVDNEEATEIVIDEKDSTQREEETMRSKNFIPKDRTRQTGGFNQPDHSGSSSSNWREGNGASYKNNRGLENRNMSKGKFNTRQSEPPKRSNDNREEGRRDKKRYSLNEKRDNSDTRRNKTRWSQEEEEFVAYQKEFDIHKGNIEYIKTREIVNNLFKMPEDYSLAHCVAEDMNMGSGIAVQFRRDFKRVTELLNQRQKKGGLAILKVKDRYIYYLVTKMCSTGKPTYATLFSSLKQLRSHVIENNVTKLAMPKIGCGLDRLDWEEVKFMVEFIFKDVDVEIVVCNYEPSEDSPQQRHKNCRVTHETYPIEKIEAGTLIVYFSSEDEHISDDMKALDEKFQFLREFRYAKKTLGRVVFYTRNKDYILCGCIVRKSQKDPFDFVALQKCLFDIQKENKKHNFVYIAFQAIKDEDSCINYKIINIMRNGMRDVDVYVCWPKELQDEMTARDRFGGYSPRASFNKGQSRNESSVKNDSWRSTNDSFVSNDSMISEGTSDYSAQNNSSMWDNSFESSTSKADRFWCDSVVNETPLQPETSHLNPDTNMEQLESWDQPETRSTNMAPLDESRDQPEIQTHHSNPNETTNIGPVASDINHDYEMFELDFESNSIECSLVKEQNTRDNLPKQYSSVCYAREDLIMESGIPFGPEVSQHFAKLLNQGKKEGSVAILREGNNYLYCLIIKGPTTPPKPQSVFSAIQQLGHHASQNRVKKLVIPKMDTCGDTSFEWSKVKYMFQFLLAKWNIEMTFAPFPNEFDMKSLNKRNRNKITHSKGAIHQLKPKSVTLYLASSDDHFSEEMTALEKKFKFAEDFQRKRKLLGETIPHKLNEENVIVGCVVKKAHSDPIDFESLWKCVAAVNNRNNKEKLSYVGIQAVKDQDVASINFKIAAVLLNVLENVTVIMCWPGTLKDRMPH